ncbi:MAG: ATP synthase F1 subunit epsilon [Deltaproteobacteria bacterium]|nr:ATP synthase F1 subunit epsilon [Deltaproteobacteria bacterium]
MQLDIVTPDRRVVVANADDVVIPAKEGEIDILPGHAPYLGILGTGVLRFVSEGKAIQLMVSGGFIEVDNDRVVLMCESAALQGEVVKETEMKSLHELEKQLAGLGVTSEDDASYQKLKAEVDRSAAKLTLLK